MSTAGDVVTTFNLQSYIPPDVQTDINTGAGYYNTFSQVTKGLKVGPNGSVQISDEAANAALIGINSAVTAVLTAANPAIGAAYALLMEALPQAGAGPGTCANPPAGPLPAQLEAWSNYHSWTSNYPSYPVGAAGSFEAFANPVLEYNYLLQANCFSSKSIYPPTLLATLIASWNATHQATSTRTVTRSSLNAPGWTYPAGYDPIAAALEMSLQGHTDDPFGVLAQGGSYQGVPGGQTSSFSINNGAQVVDLKAIALHNPGAVGMTGPGSSSSSSAGKRVAVAALIVVGTGAAGLGVWALATHQSYLGALKSVWKASGGKAVKAINPLPAVAMETFASASRSTTVQTLLFPRPRYSESRAKAWARAHGYGVHKAPDVKPNTIRIRQRSPEDFKKDSFRTIPLGKSGVKAVVGHLR